MANDDHIAKLLKDVTAWNAWRRKNPNIRPDLSGADLSGLANTNLSEWDPPEKILTLLRHGP